jgi:PAS domain-containing protein
VPVQRFAELADLLPEAMLLVDAGAVVVGANRAAATLIATPPAGLAGRSLVELVADPPAAVRELLKACSRTRTMTPGTLRFHQPPSKPLVCRCEGALYQPRTASAGPLVVLRLVPRDTAVGRFLELNQRIDALSGELARRRAAAGGLEG